MVRSTTAIFEIRSGRTNIREGKCGPQSNVADEEHYIEESHGHVYICALLDLKSAIYEPERASRLNLLLSVILAGSSFAQTPRSRQK